MSPPTSRHSPPIAVAAAIAMLTAGCPGWARPTRSPPPLSLVVVIVIDQLPSWGFAARQDLYQHGLRRLIREGVVFPRVAYPYALTFTAPGHAAIATGASPEVTGIVANAWYRPGQDRERAAEWDQDATILGLPGRAAEGLEGASGAALRVDGIADVLETATGGAAHTITIAGKPRAACFIGGRHPDLALWYEPALPGMTTSRRYAAALPSWALALDVTHPIAPRLSDVWTIDDARALATRSKIPDDATGEGGAGDLGTAFPHLLTNSADRARALRATPFLDEIEVDTAIAAIDGELLGADETIDLLAISFSAHDYAGHLWGQESWEMIELERRLDRELARLFDHLDRRVGTDRYAVVLTSDHGATPLVERGRYPGARRIAPTELKAAAEAAATQALGPGTWIAAVSSGMVYASPALTAHPRRDAVLNAIADAVTRAPNVARAIRIDTLPGDCNGLELLDLSACRSRVRGESGEILVVPRNGSLITSHTVGTTHDAPSSDNREVPVIIRVPGAYIRSGDPLPSTLSIAPTIAELLGVPPPPAATAPPLIRRRGRSHN